MNSGTIHTANQPVHIFLLGRFELAWGEQHLKTSHWKRNKAAALLQRLALERRLLKEQAIEFLWPEADPNYGANNLYRTLYALRQTLTRELGLDTPEAVFTFDDGRLQLNEAVWVDVHEFNRLLSPQPPSVEALQEAIALYRGDLLPDDLYSEWTQTPRETLRRAYREAALTLADHHRQSGNYAAAIALLAPLLKGDPADEPAHRELMRLYALNGRRHDALRQYQACVEALATELEVPPSPETEALYTQILSGDLLAQPEPASPSTPSPADSQWLPPAPIAVEVTTGSPLMGREAELQRVQAGLSDARSGQGRTILLAGETGLGKTCLAYEALRLAANEGMVTLFGAAYEQEGQLPYQPFIEAFNRYLAQQQRPFADNPITHFQPAAAGDPQQQQWALFNNTANFLAGLSQQAPLLLLVDDLHAADEASLHLFHYLARHTRHTPIVLLATYRTDTGLPDNTPFNALLHALYRERLRTLIELTPLSAETTAALVAQLSGAKVEPGLQQAIFHMTEGNPFFTEEVARALGRLAGVEMVDGKWRIKPGVELSAPDELSELLRQQLSPLGTAVTAALETAAVIGRQFRFELLRRASHLAEGELLDALDAALAARLIAETEEGYRFRHGLIRHVLYEAQSRARHRRRHTLVATALEKMQPQRREDPSWLVETLAYHFERSQERQHALPYLLEAGQKAADVFAFDVAVDHYQRALALMDELGLDDPAQRWTILESLGWWRHILADSPQAVACFEQALDLPPAASWQAAGHDRVRLHCGAAMTLLTAGDAATAETHLQAALDEVSADQDAAEYADVLYNMAQVHWHRNEYQAAYDLAQRSLTIAERLNKPDAIARAFEMLALACHSLGEWQQGLAFEEKRADVTGSTLDVGDAFDVHL